MQHTPFTDSDTTGRAGDGEQLLWIHVPHSHPTRILRGSSPKLCNWEHSTELRWESDCLFRAILVIVLTISAGGASGFLASEDDGGRGEDGAEFARGEGFQRAQAAFEVL